MVDTSWDIEKYKTHYESDDHWELKRKFMTTHKEALPEDELVCMAQVFANVEFLGCRYPNETMTRVAELAKGVVEEFREKRKHNLKRTFVTASDAASSKVKGLDLDKSKKKRGEKQAEKSKTFLEIHPRPGMLGKFVLYITPSHTSQQNLQRSIQLNRAQYGTKFESTVLPNGLIHVQYFIHHELISEAKAEFKKKAIALAADLAVENLRKRCYSVIVKDQLIGKTVDKLDISDEPMPDKKLSDDNIGSKLMKLMGWTGGGLGSAEQGRAEPVIAQTNMLRAGLGACSVALFRKAVRQYLLEWFQAGATTDLTFSNEFDRKHRKIIHEVGLSFGVKTQSYGSQENRRLVVSTKTTPWDLVLELARGGDRCQKYQLLLPGSDSVVK